MESKQDIFLFSRNRMELTGIDEVESFTDTEIILSSQLGMISVYGGDMKIESFSTESGEVKLTGKFDGFSYFGKDEKKEKSGIFAKMFG